MILCYSDFNCVDENTKNLSVLNNVTLKFEKLFQSTFYTRLIIVDKHIQIRNYANKFNNDDLHHFPVDGGQ